MRRFKVFVLLLCLSMLVACNSLKESKETEAETKTTKTTTTSLEETIAATENSEVVVTEPEISHTEDEIDFSDFSTNASIYLRDGNTCFGTLTLEDKDIITEDFDLNMDYSSDFNEDINHNKNYGVGVGYFVQCFDKPEDADINFICPIPADETHNGDSCRPFYIKTENVSNEIQERLGISLDQLTYNPLYKVDYEGEECYMMDTGLIYPNYPSAEFKILGGNKVGNGYYLYLQGFFGEYLNGLSVAHVTQKEDGHYKIEGARYAFNWDYVSSMLSDTEVISAEDIEANYKNPYYDSAYEHRPCEEYDENMKYTYSLLYYSYYAHHGCIFEDPYLQVYFESRTWYNGTIAFADFDETEFNDVERINLNEISKLIGDRNKEFEYYYENVVLPGKLPNLNLTFTMSGSYDDASNEIVYDGDTITEISGVFGHLIIDFDLDGNDEMMVFRLERNYIEPEFDHYCYRMVVDLYSKEDGEIKKTDTYTYRMYDPDDLYINDLYECIMEQTDRTTSYKIYDQYCYDYVAMVCEVSTSSVGIVDNDAFKSYFSITVKDNQIVLLTNSLQNGRGPDVNEFIKYEFVNGSEDPSKRMEYIENNGQSLIDDYSIRGITPWIIASLETQNIDKDSVPANVKYVYTIDTI